MFLLYVLCFCFVFTLHQVMAQDRRFMVNIESGQISGILLTTTQRQYSAFLGIPYAQPPRRFEHPQQPGKWSGIKETIRFQPVCPHMDHKLKRVIGNEDCLYLNVYTPSVNPGNGFGIVSYPVIVFIHGPDYTSGTGNIYGAEKFIEKDTVVVTFNYRLGSLGFLSTGDSASPGNYALHDQNMALRWVQRNIAAFQGDPGQITLMGQGTGAAMVSLHMISPLSKGLFLRAITESGNALCDWAVDEKPREISADYAQKLGRLLQCGSGYIDSNFLIRCLKTRLVTDLIKTQEKLKGFGSFPGIWKPTIDIIQTNQSRVFLPDTPKMLMLRGVTGRDLITGINQDEGSLFYYYLMKYLPNIAVDQYFLDNQLIPNFLGNLTDLYGVSVVNQIKNKYFGVLSNRQPREIIKSFTQMATDALFVGCNDKWAKEHSTSTIYNPNNLQSSPNTYSYVFTYQGQNSFANREDGALGVVKLNERETGVSNRDELLYLWNLSVLNFTGFSFFDDAVSNRVTRLWSSFVKSGVPVRFSDGEYKPWFRIESSPNSYYDIGRDLMDKSSYRQQEVQMWNEELPKISTYRPTTPLPTNQPFTSSRLTSESQPFKTATWAMLAIIIALIILCIFLCFLLISSKRKREFKAEPDVYH